MDTVDLGDALNDELLALAGDDSDDEGSSVGGSRSPKSRTPSASPPPRQSIEKPSAIAARRGTAKPVARRKQDDSEEEGEASPAPDSPGSLGSGAMDESDSDDDRASSAGDARGDDGELYPLEGKYKDARDKAYIRSLPEMQREQILTERQEERQRIDQAALLRKAIQQSELSQAKKRKAAAADLDESPQKSTRAKDKRAEALQNLKQARENRDVAGRRQAAGRRGRRSRSRSSVSSQRDADGDSDEVEFAEEPVRAPPKEQVEATLEEIERLRIGRSRFAQYCFYPNFEQLTTDAFVRIQVVDGIYKMGQIKGYTEGKPYQMELTNGRPCMSDQYATVATGETSRPWPLTHCSNSRFTPSEFDDWKRSHREAGKRTPTQPWAQKKCADLHTLVNYSLSSEEINVKLDRQRKHEHLLAARQADARAAQPLDEHAQRQQRIAEMNARNRRDNAEQIRNALLAKRAAEKEKARRMAREEASRRRAEEEAVAAAVKAKRNLEVDELFGEGGSDVSRLGTPVDGEGKKERPARKGIPTFSKRKMDDDVLSAMDFGIEIDI